MREILHSLGFSRNIADFDDYLLEIADRAEKKNYQIDRANLIKGNSTSDSLELAKAPNEFANFLKLVSEGKV